MVDLPTWAKSLKNLFRLMRLLWQTLMGVESTKEMPVHRPTFQGWLFMPGGLCHSVLYINLIEIYLI